MTRRLSASIAVVLLLLAESASAQTVGSPTTTPPADAAREVTVYAGEVFEILAVSGAGELPTWTLRQAETLIDSRKTPVLRARFVETGAYSLTADMPTENADGNATLRLSIRVVRGVGPSSNPIESGSAATEPLFTTEPTAQGTDLSLDPQTHLLTVRPNAERVTLMTIDVDGSKDDDGDGDTQNDDDIADTLSRTSLHPLYLWFPASETADRGLTFQLTLKDGSTRTDRLYIAQANGTATDTLVLQQLMLGNGSIRFGIPLVSQTGDPRVTEWSFGDGASSLLESPTHTYLTNGTFEVSVSVRSLVSGRVVASGRTTVTITDAPAGQSTSSAASSAQSSSEQPGTGGSDLRATLRLVLVIIGIVLLIGAIFGLLLWVVMRFVRGSQRRLDKPVAEHASPEEKTPQDIIDTPAAPLTLRAPAEEESVLDVSSDVTADAPTAVPTETPVSEPTVDVSEAPAWLKQGLSEDVSRVPSEPQTPPPPSPSSSASETQPSIGTDETQLEEPQPQTDGPVAPAPEPETFPDTVASSTPLEEAPQDALMDTAEPPAWLQQDLNEESAPAEPLPPPFTTEDAAQSVTPAPAIASSATDPEAEARAAAERERKRRKRQRYRENLRRRQQEAQQAPSVGTQPEATEVEAPPNANVLQPMPPVPTEKPVEQDIPPMTPSDQLPQSTPADDDIKFIIRADDVEPPEENPPRQK